MWTEIAVVVTILLIFKLLTTRRDRYDLDRIPGPEGVSILNVFSKLKSINTEKAHLTMQALYEKYGPIVKLPVIGDEFLIVSDYESFHQVLVKAGREFGGRNNVFRTRTMLDGTGILLNESPDDKWKALRKGAHKHLKQFGDGLSRLESIITLVADDMFAEFEKNSGKSYDPYQVIFDTALNSIAFLVTGERTRSGEDVVKGMREYEQLFTQCLPSTASISVRILDVLPWLRFFGWPSWKLFKRFKAAEELVWKDVKRRNDNNPQSRSVCKALEDSVSDHGVTLTENDIRKTALSLLIAGVVTTSMSFYAAVNLLAHHPGVQEMIWNEICEVTTLERPVELSDRPKMPYTRATLLEVLRYSSVVSNGVLHRTLQKTTLKGYTIPENVKVILCQYNLHHDVEFWGDPESFRPNRFLDEDGELIPADHPNRKHLMPFGAGLRVCLGESLAMTRLFLWMTTLSQRFEVFPGEGNNRSNIDTRNFTVEGVLKPTKYEVIFRMRVPT